jgi:excisionase family DNA binding protein
MDSAMLSVEQVAERLGLHVKTIRNYVREGRLKAVRIGKQYRIAPSDLAAMIGRPVSALDPPPVGRNRRVEVYSVVEVDAVSPELSERVTNMLMGAAKGRDYSEDEPLRVQAIYDAPHGRLKLILIGSIETIGALLKMIKPLLEVEK